MDKLRQIKLVEADFFYRYRDDMQPAAQWDWSGLWVIDRVSLLGFYLMMLPIVASPWDYPLGVRS